VKAKKQTIAFCPLVQNFDTVYFIYMAGFDFGFSIDQRTQNELADILSRRFRVQYDGQLPDEIARRAPRAHFLGALAEHSCMTPLPTIARAVDPTLLKNFDRAVMASGQMVPIAYEANVLAIAIADPSNRTGIDYCRQSFPTAKINIFLTYSQEISKIIEGSMGAVVADMSDIEVTEIEEASAKRDFDLTTPMDDKVADGVRLMLLRAVQIGASDIHLKVEKSRFYYQYRVDGDCGPKIELPMAVRAKLDAFLIIRSGKPVDKKNDPLSGRFTLGLDGRKVDVRYERHPAYRGFHTTMRLLDKSQIELTLGEGSMKFHPKVLDYIYRSLLLPDGIILISGPTGSGKSSTVTAFLKELNRDKYNILTLENPVEEEIPGITHVQIDNSQTDIFNMYMSSFMRSDPDIIFVGEIRDEASASAAINASTTGHQVISTVHAARASLIISRLEHFHVRRYDIAENLKAACAQRLVRTLCKHCATEGEYTREEVARNGLPESFLGQKFRRHNPMGCSECYGGYKGRLPLFEILPISLQVASRIAKGEVTALEIEETVKRDLGIPLLRDLAIEAMEQGVTDIEAVRDVVAMTI